MASSIAAIRDSQVRVKSGHWDNLEWRRFQSPLANAGGQSIGVALRCVGMQAVAAVLAVLQPVAASGVRKIGSGGVISLPSSFLRLSLVA
jgi:hypothetical protein